MYTAFCLDQGKTESPRAQPQRWPAAALLRHESSLGRSATRALAINGLDLSTAVLQMAQTRTQIRPHKSGWLNGRGEISQQSYSLLPVPVAALAVTPLQHVQRCSTLLKKLEMSFSSKNAAKGPEKHRRT